MSDHPYRTISPDELKKILADHKEWLENNGKGVRADLRFANLSSANLRYANLSSANLSYANLSSADLRYANLSSADLSSANLRYANLSSGDLSYANLSSADLSYADLSSANLRYANLRYANLSSGDLSYADLRYADLSSAGLRYANLLIFQFQRHIAYFTLDGSLRIGCHVLPIAEWLETYTQIGKEEGYSEAQIKAYGGFIKLCAEQFELACKGEKP